MRTTLVLDALGMALRPATTRRRRPSLIAPHRRREPIHESIDYTQTPRRTTASCASIGSVGDAYDNAVAESFVDSFKTELINQQGPWKTMEQVEFATLQWVDWYNHQRLHGSCDKLTPVEYEQTRARQTTQ